MSVCDICGKSGQFHQVSSDLIRGALHHGFNPFELGIASANPGMNLSPAQLFSTWKMQVENDTSDWNVCPDCLDVVDQYIF